MDTISQRSIKYTYIDVFRE